MWAPLLGAGHKYWACSEYRIVGHALRRRGSPFLRFWKCLLSKLYWYQEWHWSGLEWIGGDRAVVQMRRRRWMLRRLQTWWTSLSWTRIVLTKIVDNECGGQNFFASMSVHTRENPIQDPFDQLHLGHHWVCNSWKMFTYGFWGFPNSEHSHPLLANSPSINLRLSSKLEVHSMTVHIQKPT